MILQKYDFSSKSQRTPRLYGSILAVCDTAKVRFFKQITTISLDLNKIAPLFVILQKYDFSSKSQLYISAYVRLFAVCDTAKVRFFKQITTRDVLACADGQLFAILQKHDFSSKSQLYFLIIT